MNDMDNELRVLGPQLIKGKAIKLTKNKQEALAAWSTKLVLMSHLTHPREKRLVVPDSDYTRLYDERSPNNLTHLWAGYMEPPGKDRGPMLAFQDHRLDELFYSEAMLAASGLDPALASKGYSATFRFGCCVIGLVRVEYPELLEPHVLKNPRHWTQIWPAIGTRSWPPSMLIASGQLSPITVGLRRRAGDSNHVA